MRPHPPESASAAPLSITISWSQWHSILWAIIHGICGCSTSLYLLVDETVVRTDRSWARVIPRLRFASQLVRFILAGY